MDNGQDVHLRDYLRVIRNRRWTVIAFFLILVTSVTVWTFTTRPVFQSTVQLLIDRDNPNVVSIQEVLAVDATATDYYQTQYEILKSEMLAKRVIKRLRLDRAPEFEAGRPNPLWESVVQLWAGAGAAPAGQEAAVESEDERQRRLVRAFLLRVEVKPIRNSRLVKVALSAYDPNTAALMANTLAEEFINYNLEAKLQAAQRAAGWLQDQVTEMQTKMRFSEDALGRYKTDIPAQVMAQVSSQATMKELESRPEVVNNGFIQELKGEEIKLTAKQAELSVKFGPKHPQMIQVETELRTLRDKLEREMKRVVGAVKAEDSPQFQLLKREAETNRQLYDVLLKRFKETALTESIPRNNIQIVDPAVPAERAYKPNKRMNVMLAVIVALAGGIGLAFFLEYLDNTIKTPEDIERVLKLPLLGMVPQRRKQREGGGIDRVVAHDPRSAHAEAYRTIRTGILLSVAERQPRSILVTSPGPNEGKSATAINLAIAMAQSGNSVVLVDADLRKPRISQVLALENTRGLSQVLVGELMLDLALKTTQVPLLSAVLSGPIPPNPAELLGAQRMRDTLAELARRFDRVIIDSPPVLPVTDAIILAAACDGVVLVTKEGETAREPAQLAVRRLQEVKARVLGVVLNGVGGTSPYYYAGYPYYGKADRKQPAAAPARVPEPIPPARPREESISMIAAAVSVANKKSEIVQREMKVRPAPEHKGKDGDD